MRVESQVLQWTREQWAEAASAYETRHQWLPLPDCRGAVDVQESWLMHRPDAPSGRLLLFAAGAKPMNFAWAARMMRSVAAECAASMRPERRSGKDRRRA